MGSIGSTIEVRDAATSVFSKIANTVQRVISSFDGAGAGADALADATQLAAASAANAASQAAAETQAWTDAYNGLNDGGEFAPDAMVRAGDAAESAARASEMYGETLNQVIDKEQEAAKGAQDFTQAVQQTDSAMESMSQSSSNAGTGINTFAEASHAAADGSRDVTQAAQQMYDETGFAAQSFNSAAASADAFAGASQTAGSETSAAAVSISSASRQAEADMQAWMAAFDRLTESGMSTSDALAQVKDTAAATGRGGEAYISALNQMASKGQEVAKGAQDAAQAVKQTDTATSSAAQSVGGRFVAALRNGFSSLRSFYTSAQIAQTGAEGLEQSLEPLADQQEAVNQKFNESEPPSGKLREFGSAAQEAASGGCQSLIKSLSSLAAGYMSLKQAISSVNDAMSADTYGLKLEALMGSDVGSAATDWAKNAAKVAGREYSDVLSSTLSNAKLGLSGKNIQLATEIADRLARFTDENDYSAMVDAIQQAFRTGRTQALSSAMGLSTNALESFGLDAAIDAGNIDAFLEGLEAAADAAGMTKEALALITEGSESQWEMFKNNIKNNVTEAASSFLDEFAPVFAQLNEWLASSDAQIFFAVLSAAFRAAGQVASWFVGILMKAANWIAENWELVFTAAAIAVGIFAAQMLFAALSTMAANIPLLILIGLALAVAAALKSMGYTVEDIAGTIGGVIGVMVAFVYNRFVDLWNFIATFVNFFGNAFNDPVGAIKILFMELAEWVIGLIADMASAIETLLNKIPGVKVDMTSWSSGLLKELEDAATKVKSEMEWVEYVEKMDYWSYDKAWDAGYEKGSDIASGIEDTMSGLTDSLGAMDDFNDFTDWGGTDIGNSLGSIDKNVASIADCSEEDLKYLRDIAEREVINRFTTAEIKVEQTNNNNLSSDMDIDGFMDKWTEDFTEILEVAAEGVHP